MKYNFKEKAKMTGMTGAEVAVVGASALLSQKFLSFDMIFKNQIAADPTFKDNWYIKHQGGIKFVVGALAAAHIKNPWMRLIAVGVSLNGFIQEARVLTTDSTGVPTFDAIGNLDRKLLNAANMANGPMMERGMGAVGDRYQTMVAGEPPVGKRYPTQVARPVDLMGPSYTSVGNTGAVMMRG